MHLFSADVVSDYVGQVTSIGVGQSTGIYLHYGYMYISLSKEYLLRSLIESLSTLLDV